MNTTEALTTMKVAIGAYTEGATENRTMKRIKENALVAVLDDEEADAAELIAQLLPGERARLAKAACRLAKLCEAE